MNRNTTLKTPKARREEAMRREKLFHLQSQALCALVNSMGASYGITAREGEYWYEDGEGRQRRYEVSCRIDGAYSYRVLLTSPIFIKDVDLLDLVIRCVANQPGFATGKEYSEVATCFGVGLWVEKNVFLADDLYRRAVDAGYHPAIAELFRHKCENWCGREEGFLNWDYIYQNYKEMREKGLTKSELNKMDPAVVYAVRVEERAEQGDTGSIREIARYYLSQGKRYKRAYSKYMRLLAEKGEEDGIVYMSLYHFKKKGTLRKKAKTLNFHLKGADMGNAECMYRSGRIYELMAQETPEYMRDAISYYEMSAQKGILKSMSRLALIYAQEGTDHYDKERAGFYKGKTLELLGTK